MKRVTSQTNPLTGMNRRKFLARSFLWASSGLMAAPRRGWAAFQSDEGAPLPRGPAVSPPSFDRDRLTPHYKQPAPIDEVLRQVEPGLDAFISEKYAAEIEEILSRWSSELIASPAAFAAVENSIAPEVDAASLKPSERRPMRPLAGLEVFRNRFPAALNPGKREFIAGLKTFVGAFSRLSTAEFKLIEFSTSGDAGRLSAIHTRVRYDFVGSGVEFFRGERVGHWNLEWVRDSASQWRVRKWRAEEETECRASAPVFVEITGRALASCASYRQQLQPGIDHWRTVLDGATRIDVYGNNGIAVGDIDGDGFDDVYVCQPSGLPNRLYHNRGDGTFEDITEKSGVGVLDNSPCALFADLNNRGRQDLIVVTVDGPLLFLNQGDGRFDHQPDAFRFAHPPLGTFTGAALADYDGDGRLDVYFCLYSYYLGQNQYQYPSPYYDAQNGPPNFLMHNQGDGTFADVTAASGMNVNNHRYSFTCGWCDFDRDGRPDLYVVNDFGRKNLYRNNGDGTFTDVAREAGVEDVGAGMSVCWFDYANDGRQDLYVADMWSAAGLRVSGQENFLEGAPEEARALLRKHASGNSLFHHEGDRHFSDASAAAGVQMGRWSWSSDAWDFDHDGYPDIYIANGMISGPNRRELSSFFWRQVVAQTPVTAGASPQTIASPQYERGWNAINELIRADGTWSGYERNNFLANNRDGTFSEVAGALGLDFIEDSRAFSLADFDHDGRLEVFLKNRSGPQLRILRNEMKAIGHSIAFRLRGHRNNRDAIGAGITIESGDRRQTKFIQAGSGFLSQHTKDLYFGLGKADGKMRATVRWPGGLVQQFENVPPEHLIWIEEGSTEFRAEPFRPYSPSPEVGAVENESRAPDSTSAETWLLAPVAAPDFSLPDASGRARSLAEFRGRSLLLYFGRTSSPAWQKDLALFEKRHAGWAAQGLQLLAICLDALEGRERARSPAWGKRYSFPILFADDETAAIYNILYRYLFDRRRNLGIPTSFLVDEKGQIVKVYQGSVNAAHVEADFRGIPQTAAERAAKGLPFPGQLYGNEFRRNQFTYALVFLERGYFDPALRACRQVAESEPEDAEVRYLLGMIYLKKGMRQEARQSFEQTLRSRPSYPHTFPDAWNNLGMLAAQEGRDADAIAALQKAIELNSQYSIALENLGNVYRQQRRWPEAQAALERALEIDPQDADAHYGLAMTFAQQDDTASAEKYFDNALKLRPDFPEALNNLGILYLRTRRIEEGVREFETCIRVAPAFEQAYINLAKVFAQRGRADQAAAALRQLLQQHPDDERARQMLKELNQ